jgi:sodium/bile acid cotransporter 7
MTGMKIDGFLVGMLIALGAALLAPGLGVDDGPLHLGSVTNVGIALLFFLHGVSLSPATLRSAATRWRVHLLVQTATYVAFPLLGFLLVFLTEGWLDQSARIGIFFLCAVSSTLSSSVALAAMAKGNVPASIFNATLSGLLGLLLTPLLVSSVVAAVDAHGLPLGSMLLSIATKMLAPFIVGLLLHPLIGGVLARYKAVTAKLDRGVILLIIYAAFCNAAVAGIWTRYSPAVYLQIGLVVALLLLLLLLATTWVSRALGLERADEVTVVFCGSQKSLASGAPIAKVLFGAGGNLALILLPLLMFHQLQLIVCGMLARRYAAAAAKSAAVGDLARAVRLPPR